MVLRAGTPSPRILNEGVPVMNPATVPLLRHDWSREEVEALYRAPFLDLIFAAQAAHRAHHEPNTVQMSRTVPTARRACATTPASRPRH